MNWIIELNKSVEQFIKDLDDKTQVEVLNTMNLLSEHGLNLKMPFVKHIQGKMYELRVMENKNNYRFFYFAYTGKKFVFIHSILKKTQKTPKKDLDLALKRMNDYLRG